ncbi:hypothetical protein GN956_G1015 [Arapaima gigas]
MAEWLRRSPPASPAEALRSLHALPPSPRHGRLPQEADAILLQDTDRLETRKLPSSAIVPLNKQPKVKSSGTISIRCNSEGRDAEVLEIAELEGVAEEGTQIS